MAVLKMNKFYGRDTVEEIYTNKEDIIRDMVVVHPLLQPDGEKCIEI